MNTRAPAVLIIYIICAVFCGRLRMVNWTNLPAAPPAILILPLAKEPWSARHHYNQPNLTKKRKWMAMFYKKKSYPRVTTFYLIRSSQIALRMWIVLSKNHLEVDPNFSWNCVWHKKGTLSPSLKKWSRQYTIFRDHNLAISPLEYLRTNLPARQKQWNIKQQYC